PHPHGRRGAPWGCRDRRRWRASDAPRRRAHRGGVGGRGGRGGGVGGWGNGGFETRRFATLLNHLTSTPAVSALERPGVRARPAARPSAADYRGARPTQRWHRDWRERAAGTAVPRGHASGDGIRTP